MIEFKTSRSDTMLNYQFFQNFGNLTFETISNITW